MGTNVSRAASGMQRSSPGSFARLDPEVCRLLGEIMRDSRGLLRCVMLRAVSAEQALAFFDSAWPGAEYAYRAKAGQGFHSAICSLLGAFLY